VAPVHLLFSVVLKGNCGFPYWLVTVDHRARSILQFSSSRWSSRSSAGSFSKAVSLRLRERSLGSFFRQLSTVAVTLDSTSAPVSGPDSFAGALILPTENLRFHLVCDRGCIQAYAIVNRQADWLGPPAAQRFTITPNPPTKPAAFRSHSALRLDCEQKKLRPLDA